MHMRICPFPTHAQHNKQRTQEPRTLTKSTMPPEFDPTAMVRGHAQPARQLVHTVQLVRRSPNDTNPETWRVCRPKRTKDGGEQGAVMVKVLYVHVRTGTTTAMRTTVRHHELQLERLSKKRSLKPTLPIFPSWDVIIVVVYIHAQQDAIPIGRSN